MAKMEFEEKESIFLLDELSDIRQIATKIGAVYSDIYEYIFERDSEAYEDENESKYMIYADIVFEYIDKLKDSLDIFAEKLDKRQKKG